MRKFLYLLPFLFACKTIQTKEVIIYRTKDSTAIHVDTIWKTYYNPADSLLLSGQLSATMDSLGKCRVKDTEGTIESSKIKIKYIIKNDTIFIECFTKPYEIKIAQLTYTIEHFTELYESYYKQETVVKKKTWLSFKESWICLFVIGVFVVYFLMKIIRSILKKLGYKIGFIAAPPFITITK